MIRDEELHTTHYVLTHFRHLMADEEREALASIVMTDTTSGKEKLIIQTPGRSAPSKNVELLLADGMQTLRKKVRDRLVAAYREDIYANSCPKCGRLPSTPKAKQCLFCSHSWRNDV